ncbi:hypothetical protein CUMW_161470 [Citrus unshiu]|uniref:Fucosyltransferase n=1 Tax=Citrus unshiu TaxID=55188 RepID=A0A2H5PRS5_CITUN|nr:hypothetical protein CUMW_161470 [Citrus unshiu]
MAILFCDHFQMQHGCCQGLSFMYRISRFKQNICCQTPLSLPCVMIMIIMDKLFFCDQDPNYSQEHTVVDNEANLYFLPSLFLMSSFEEELDKLFPDKEMVFHHLGRYLFHPSNQVWKLITRLLQKISG